MPCNCLLFFARSYKKKFCAGKLCLLGCSHILMVSWFHVPSQRMYSSRSCLPSNKHRNTCSGHFEHYSPIPTHDIIKINYPLHFGISIYIMSIITSKSQHFFIIFHFYKNSPSHIRHLTLPSHIPPPPKTERTMLIVDIMSSSTNELCF